MHQTSLKHGNSGRLWLRSHQHLTSFHRTTSRTTPRKRQQFANSPRSTRSTFFKRFTAMSQSRTVLSWVQDWWIHLNGLECLDSLGTPRMANAAMKHLTDAKVVCQCLSPKAVSTDRNISVTACGSTSLGVDGRTIQRIIDFFWFKVLPILHWILFLLSQSPSWRLQIQTPPIVAHDLGDLTYPVIEYGWNCIHPAIRRSFGHVKMIVYHYQPRVMTQFC